MLALGWQRADSVGYQPCEPAMFADRVRVRGPMHRTWLSAWAGPREETVRRGRDTERPSFELVHPGAAGSLDRTLEHLFYGAGIVAHDARWGRRMPSGNHWPSDVFFAAVHGTLVSRTVVKLHEARESGRPDGMTLVPRFAGDGTLAGLQLTRRF